MRLLERQLSESNVLVELRSVDKSFAVAGGSFRPKKQLHAISDVSLSIRRGEVMALVGESGSGKSTLGRIILRLLDPTAGKVTFDGHDLGGLSKSELRKFRRRMQLIFQDPFAALNPHMRIGSALGEALAIHGLAQSKEDKQRQINVLLSTVGLSPEMADRFPHEFSGGQRQRIVIARTLAVRPDFIVADEAISALDVSNQAQIMNVLLDLKRERNLTMLFITHNLAVVQNIADTVAVLYLGRVMEIGPASTLFSNPGHPYTAALLQSIPIPVVKKERTRVVLQGDIPSPMNPPGGCVFRTRCEYALGKCATIVPELNTTLGGRKIACIRHEELADVLREQMVAFRSMRSRAENCIETSLDKGEVQMC